jgi:hypothetical protein
LAAQLHIVEQPNGTSNHSLIQQFSFPCRYRPFGLKSFHFFLPQQFNSHSQNLNHAKRSNEIFHYYANCNENMAKILFGTLPKCFTTRRRGGKHSPAFSLASFPTGTRINFHSALNYYKFQYEERHEN